MTTNHKSGITHSESKESNEDEGFARGKWQEHRNTVSVIRDSFMELKEITRNHASFVVGDYNNVERRIEGNWANNQSATYCSQPAIKPN